MAAGEPTAYLKDLAGLFTALAGRSADQADLDEAAALVRTLEDRLSFAEAPPLVVLAGPPGAGKSYIFNALAGEELSPSSHIRPGTLEPVLAAPPPVLARLAQSPVFLPEYEKLPAAALPPGAARRPGAVLRLAAANSPRWPGGLALMDSPDFDSVVMENQEQARALSRRADAVIFVTTPAKYADQSVWDFLALEKEQGRPLLIVMNRGGDPEARRDFQNRLRNFAVSAPLAIWPDKGKGGGDEPREARESVESWLAERGREGAALVAARDRGLVRRLELTARKKIAAPLAAEEAELKERLDAVRSVTAQWMREPRQQLALSLPGETRAALLRNLSAVVQRSDLWAAPRRFLARPFRGLRRRLGRGREPADDQLAPGLVELGRETLSAAVRGQARALAAAAGLAQPPPGLDLTREEIEERHVVLEAQLNGWFKAETEKLLSGLPVGQKALFYLVQFTHLGAVLGLSIHMGGIPGTEVLVGGALGPLLSKLTGAVISRDRLDRFEARTDEFYRARLAEIFEEQGRRYKSRLRAPLSLLARLEELKPLLDGLKQGLEKRP